MNFIYIILFSLFLIIKLISKYSHKNGKRAEKKVFGELEKLNSNEYLIYNDIIIEDSNYITQIDHIVLSKKGIFIIETKDYAGKIYGSENMYKWKQYLSRNEYEFYNPIKQNNTHINFLAKKLKTNRSKFISIIAFTGRADLNLTTNTQVCYINEIKDVILEYNENIIIQEELDNIYNVLEPISNNITDELREKHKQIVINSINKSEENISNNICPLCGNTLVRRNGKFGKFMGCTNYPKCKYTNN